MALTVTAPIKDLTVAGSGTISTSAISSTDETEVWITEVGGPRVVKVPKAAILGLTWGETLQPFPSAQATLTVDRYWLLTGSPTSWLVAELKRVEREIQIVHKGRVVFWGPILSRQRVPGSPTDQVSAVGSEWWFGSRLTGAAQTRWGREWLNNRDFEDGLQGWNAQGGAVLDNTQQESGAYCVNLNTGTVAQGVHFWFTSSTWMVTARVFVPSALTDDEPILQVTVPGSSNFAAFRQTVTASSATRDQWSTVVVLVDGIEAGGEAAPGRTMTVKGVGSASGDVLVNAMSVQVSPESLGLPADVHRALLHQTKDVAWLSIVNGCMDGFNIAASATAIGSSVEVPWFRADVFASEAGRQLTEAGGVEIEMVYGETTRVGLLHIGLRGTQHAAIDLTLTPGGNVVSVDGWTSGTGKPVTEWTVVDEQGFSGVYRDPSLFGGLLLQAYIQAPTGTATSALVPRAQFEAERAADALTESWQLSLDFDLTDTVRLGDRCWFDGPDGPDTYAGWVRIEQVSISPEAATFGVVATKWAP